MWGRCVCGVGLGLVLLALTTYVVNVQAAKAPPYQSASTPRRLSKTNRPKPQQPKSVSRASPMKDPELLPLFGPGIADPTHPYQSLVATLPTRDTSRFDKPAGPRGSGIQVCKFAVDSKLSIAAGSDGSQTEVQTSIWFSFDTKVSRDGPRPTIYTNFKSILTHFTPDTNLLGHYERWLIFDVFDVNQSRNAPRRPISQLFQTKAWDSSTWERYSATEDTPVPVGVPDCTTYDDKAEPELKETLHKNVVALCWHYIFLALQDPSWYNMVTDSVEGAILGEHLCELAINNADDDGWQLWLQVGLARHETRSRQVRVGTARYFAIMKKIVHGEIFKKVDGSFVFDSKENIHKVTHPGFVWDMAMEALAVGLQDMDIEFCRWLVSLIDTPLFEYRKLGNTELPATLKHLTALVHLYASEYDEATKAVASLYDDGDPKSESPEFLVGFLLFWLEKQLLDKGDANATLQDGKVRETLVAAREDYNDMLKAGINRYRGFVPPRPPPLRVHPGEKYRLRRTKWQPTRLDHIPTPEEWHGYMQRREPFIISLEQTRDPPSTSSEGEILATGSNNATDLYGLLGLTTDGDDAETIHSRHAVKQQRARASEIQRRGGSSSSYVRLLHTKESDRMATAQPTATNDSAGVVASSSAACPLLTQAFGWNTCNWESEYLCHKAGAETVSLASQNVDSGAPVFSGTTRLRREFVRYCDYVRMIFDPEFNITAPTYFDAGSIAERKSGASSIYQTAAATGKSIYGFPLDRMKEDIPMPAIFKEAGLKPQGVSFWMGAATPDRPGISGLHYDRLDNFHVLLRGRKEWKVFSPADAMHMEYVVPPHFVDTIGEVDQLQGYKQVEYYRYYGYNTVTRFSRSVSAHGNREYEYDDLPNFHKATMVSFTLHAGEAVYLPSGWAHDVSSSGVHQAITYWFNCDTICDQSKVFL